MFHQEENHVSLSRHVPNSADVIFKRRLKFLDFLCLLTILRELLLKK